MLFLAPSDKGFEGFPGKCVVVRTERLADGKTWVELYADFVALIVYGIDNRALSLLYLVAVGVHAVLHLASDFSERV